MDCPLLSGEGGGVEAHERLRGRRGPNPEPMASASALKGVPEIGVLRPCKKKRAPCIHPQRPLHLLSITGPERRNKAKTGRNKTKHQGVSKTPKAVNAQALSGDDNADR